MAIGIVMIVHNQLPLTRACLESLHSTAGVSFELCVVDNGSSDGTEEYFRHATHPYRVLYRRNSANVGLIRALNQGATLAKGDFLCFLHNDTEVREPRWLERLRAAVDSASDVGLSGLYGARRVRRDGRYAGRTIVHCLDGPANVEDSTTEVAAVDGVCLFLRRSLFDSVGGFDEGYGFFHGYDRDLSFAVREAGWRCVVVNAPFVHRGGGTRTGDSAPLTADEDLAQRRAALARFATRWRHRLPSDVRPLRERLTDRLRRLRTT